MITLIANWAKLFTVMLPIIRITLFASMPKPFLRSYSFLCKNPCILRVFSTYFLRIFCIAAERICTISGYRGIAVAAGPASVTVGNQHLLNTCLGQLLMIRTAVLNIILCVLILYRYSWPQLNYIHPLVVAIIPMFSS